MRIPQMHRICSDSEAGEIKTWEPLDTHIIGCAAREDCVGDVDFLRDTHEEGEPFPPEDLQ
jgi:hypothetical protein